MAADLEDFVKRLLHDVALAGPRGLGTDEVVEAIGSYSETIDAGTASSKNDSIEEHVQEASAQKISPAFVDSIWDLLVRHSDIHVEPIDQGFSYVQAHDSEDVIETLNTSSDCHHAGKRLIASANRIWQAVAGHGVDHTRITALEFDLLLEITARDSVGILQADLAHVTNQDIRSVPKRTDSLAAKKYIVKDAVSVGSRVTSLLRLTKFKGTSHPLLAISGQYETWYNEVIRSLQNQPDRRMALPDLYVAIGIRRKKTPIRQLRRRLAYLSETGLLRQMTVMSKPVHANARTDGTVESTPVRCVELLRDPTEADKVAWGKLHSNAKARTVRVGKKQSRAVVSDRESDAADDTEDDQHEQAYGDHHRGDETHNTSTKATLVDRVGTVPTLTTSRKLREGSYEMQVDNDSAAPTTSQIAPRTRTQPMRTTRITKAMKRNQETNQSLDNLQDGIDTDASSEDGTDINQMQESELHYGVVIPSDPKSAPTSPFQKIVDRYASLCKYMELRLPQASPEGTNRYQYNPIPALAVRPEQGHRNFKAFAHKSAKKLAQVEINKSHRFENVDGINGLLLPSPIHVARLELDILRKTRCGVYIDPPGSRRPDLTGKSIIAVAKSEQIKNYPWFMQTKPATSPCQHSANNSSVTDLGLGPDGQRFVDVSDMMLEAVLAKNAKETSVSEHLEESYMQEMSYQDAGSLDAEAFQISRKRKRHGSIGAAEVLQPLKAKHAITQLLASTESRGAYVAAGASAVAEHATAEIPLPTALVQTNGISQSEFDPEQVTRKKIRRNKANSLAMPPIAPALKNRPRKLGRPTKAEKAERDRIQREFLATLMDQPQATAIRDHVATKMVRISEDNAVDKAAAAKGQTPQDSGVASISDTPRFLSGLLTERDHPAIPGLQTTLYNANSTKQHNNSADVSFALSSHDKPRQPIDQDLSNIDKVAAPVTAIFTSADHGAHGQLPRPPTICTSQDMLPGSTSGHSTSKSPHLLASDQLQVPGVSGTADEHPKALGESILADPTHNRESDAAGNYSHGAAAASIIHKPGDSRSRPCDTSDSSRLPRTGPIAARRKALVLDIVRQAGGVFPGSREIWQPFVSQWESLEPLAKRPEKATINNTMRTLESNGELRFETFAFQRNGRSVIRKVMYLPGTSPALVNDTKDKIRDRHPGHYVPDGIAVRPESCEQIEQGPIMGSLTQQPYGVTQTNGGLTSGQLGAWDEYPLIEGLSVQRTPQAVGIRKAEKINKNPGTTEHKSASSAPLQRPTGRLSRLLPLKLRPKIRTLTRSAGQVYLPSQSAHSTLVPEYYVLNVPTSKSRFSTLGLDKPTQLITESSHQDHNAKNVAEVAEAAEAARITEPLRKKYTSRKRKANDDETENGNTVQTVSAGPMVKKKKTWTGPFQDVDRLITAVALIRCLCSGYTQVYIKWPLVAHALRFRYPAHKLQQTWNFQKLTRMKDVLELEQVMREPLLKAYENGELPKINFYDPEHTDWAAMYDWVEISIAAPLRERRCAAQAAEEVKPESVESLDNIDKRFEVVEMAQTYEPERDAFFGHPTSTGRAALVRSYAYTDALPLESRKDAPNDLLLLRSWCRAVIATKDWRYDPEAAAAKVGEFSAASLKKANAELVKAHILQPSKKSRMTPGRSYNFHESVWKAFKRWSLDDYSYLRDVAKYSSTITSDIGKTGYYQLSFHASNAEIVALSNLVASRCIKIRTLLPERNDDFEAPFPKLSAFGYLDYGYDTKKMDRTRLQFPIIYEKGTRWTQAHGLKTIAVPLSPEPFPGDGDRRRLPFWIDIHGNLVDDIWDMTLRSVLHLTVFRPGSTSVLMENAHQGKLWQWEIDVVLQWMDETGLAMKWGAGHEVNGVWTGGWRATDWWFHAFTPEVTTWRAPKPPRRQMQTEDNVPEPNGLMLQAGSHPAGEN